MNTDVLTEAAFAIYAEFVRERDPARARHRFERLKPAIRQQYESEAKAAWRVFEAYRAGEFA